PPALISIAILPLLLLVLEIDCMHQNIAGGRNAGLALLCVLLDCGFVCRVTAKKLLHAIAYRGISDQAFGFIVHKAANGLQICYRLLTEYQPHSLSSLLLIKRDPTVLWYLNPLV